MGVSYTTREFARVQLITCTHTRRHVLAYSRRPILVLIFSASGSLYSSCSISMHFRVATSAIAHKLQAKIQRKLLVRVNDCTTLNQLLEFDVVMKLEAHNFAVPFLWHTHTHIRKTEIFPQQVFISYKYCGKIMCYKMSAADGLDPTKPLWGQFASITEQGASKNVH